MTEQQVFILIAVLAVLMITVSLIFLRTKRKETKPLTPLAGLAFACVLAGIIFGEERWLGYSLIGIGVVLAVVDIIIKNRKSK